MKKLSLALGALALLVSANDVAAQGQLNVGPFVRTFSSSLTRGYWFQAPVAFTITALQVPDDTGHGTQNVEVFKMASAPPAWSANASGGQVFYKTGVPSNQVIPCNLSFAKGDFVGILGACGTSTMHNSYGNSQVASTLLGNPVTLTRFLTQSSIVTSGGNQPYSQEATGPIGRVYVWIGGGAAVTYGMGSPVSGQQAPDFLTTQPPTIGTTAELDLVNFDANALIGSVMVGFGRANIPTPFGTLLVSSPFGSFPAPVAGPLMVGSNKIPLPIPNDPNLITGNPLNFQAVTFNPIAPGIATSPGVEWVIGK